MNCRPSGDVSGDSPDRVAPGEGHAAVVSLRGFLALAVGSAVIVALVIGRFASIEQLRSAFAAADFTYTAPVLAATVCGMALAILRWQHVLGLLGVGLSWLRCARAVIAVFPLSVVAPARSNEFLRAFVIRDHARLRTGMVSVAIERVLDVLVLMTMAILGLMIAGFPRIAAVILLATPATGWFAWKLVRRKRLAWLAELGEGLRRSVSDAWRFPHLGFAAAASIGAWCMACIMMVGLLASYGADVPTRYVLAAWPMAILVGTLPISLGGVGTRDAAFLAILAFLEVEGVNEAAVISATLSYAVVGIWSWAILGTPLMIQLGLKEAGRHRASNGSANE